MKNLCFVFNNMKDAEYYWRELSYVLKNTDPYLESFRGPFRITTYVKKEKKVSTIRNILIKLKLAKKEYFEIPTEITFKSINSNLKGIADQYYFGEDYYDDSYLLRFLRERV